MKLWSNDLFSEFAIKFNSVVVAKTSDNSDAIVKMIDECQVMKLIGIILYLNG